MTGTRVGPFTILWLDENFAGQPLSARDMVVEHGPNRLTIPGTLRSRLADVIRPAEWADVLKALDSYVAAAQRTALTEDDERWLDGSRTTKQRLQRDLERAKQDETQRRAALLALIGGGP